MRRVASTRSGSCRCSQRSFGPIDCCVTPAPVRRSTASSPSSARSSSISRSARPSLYSSAGRSGSSAASSRSRHGTQPATPTAVTSPGAMPAAAHTSGTIAIAPASQSRGSASEYDGPGEVVSWLRETAATMPRAGSSTTAFSAVVPTSRPSSISAGVVGRGQEPAHPVAVDRVPACRRRT